MGCDLLAVVGDFWADNPIPKNCNSSHIVLSPKKNNSTSFSDLHPISLCTFVSEVIAKVVAMRLNHFLPLIIADNQAGFVKDQNIYDNIPVALGMANSLNKKVQGKI